MKIVTLSILLLIAVNSFAQEYKIENKSVEFISEIKGKNKNTIFASVNKWIANNYTSSKDVVQLNDIESGTIIVRGINTVYFKNYYQALTPEIKMIDTVAYTKYNHLLEINVKDEKIRINFKLNNIAFDDAGLNEIIFSTINLQGVTPEQIVKFNNFLDDKYAVTMKKTNFIANYQSIVNPMFNEISVNSLTDIKKTIQLIILFCSDNVRDKW